MWSEGGPVLLVAVKTADASAGTMIRGSYTAGKHLATINISGGVFNPAEAASSARPALIECKAGSGVGVYITCRGDVPAV